MPFVKGKPRAPRAGRQKGTPNKKTQSLHAICEEMGVDPFRALLLMSIEAEKEETRLGALKELCQYLYPKRKALEISGDVDFALLEKIEEMKKLPDTALAKIVTNEK